MSHTFTTKLLTSTVLSASLLSLGIWGSAIEPAFAQDKAATEEGQQVAPPTQDKPHAEGPKQFEDFSQEAPNGEKRDNSPQSNPGNSPMSVAQLTNIIKDVGTDVEQQNNGLISFTFDGAQLMAMTAEPVNRMRIVAPVISAGDLTQEQMAAILISNYHLALDARYAVGDGVLYSVFIHPLKELTPEQVLSAIRQVSTLRNTFGTTYTSGEMSFGAQRQEQERLDI